MTVDEYKEEVERNRPRMISVARSYLKASEEAEDVVQDVLLKLWQLLDKLRIPMGPLALVLVRNRCIDCLRRLQSTIALPENVVESEPTCDERYEKVMQLVDKLPTMQQTIMRLRHMEGMEMYEIAELTGSKEAAIRKSLSRARQAIRQQLKQQSNE